MFIIIFTVVLWLTVISGLVVVIDKIDKDSAISGFIITSVILFSWMYYVFLSGLGWPGG